MKSIIKTLSVLLALLAALTLASCGAREESDAGITVVCDIHPYAVLARALLDGIGTVEQLLPDGGDIHSYEPSPGDIRTLSGADIFFYNGSAADGWADALLPYVQGSAYRMLEEAGGVLSAGHEEEPSDAHDEHDEHDAHDGHTHTVDEHVWTSPKNALRIAERMKSALSAALEGDSLAVLEANAAALEERIRAIDAAYASYFGEARRTLLFGDRFPFAYAARDYGFDWEAVFPGCSADTEPSAAAVASMIARVRDTGAPVIFYLYGSGGDIASSIAEQTGVRTAMLYSGLNPDRAAGRDYLDMLEENLRVIKEAFGENGAAAG